MSKFDFGPRKKRILIVDDDKSIHIATKMLLKEKYDCASAYNGDEAKAIISNQNFDVVLLDISMRTHEEGLEVLPKLKAIEPELDVIMVSSNSELNLASRAMSAGAAAYLIKGHAPDQLAITIESVLNRRVLINENRHFENDRKRAVEKNLIIGRSPAIKQLLKDIEKVKRSRANVIITAETGAGKELVARLISAGDSRPFVAIDSSTITSTMAESILFGHEKGAFTGAVTQMRGLFEEANGGTIYFDEISNMPLEIQAKLLRIVQEKEVARLGSAKVIPLDFRVICATNKDLLQMSKEGRFKDDLYQRLNVISLKIPPLRERTEDIELLAEHFFTKYKLPGSPGRFSESALIALKQYSWPGNIRELSNLVSNMCTMIVDQEVVELSDLPAHISEVPVAVISITSNDSPIGPRLDIDGEMDFYKYMNQIEGEVLRNLYKKFNGNITKMSKDLNISRSHLYSKLYAHQLHS